MDDGLNPPLHLMQAKKSGDKRLRVVFNMHEVRLQDLLQLLELISTYCLQHVKLVFSIVKQAATLA